MQADLSDLVEWQNNMPVDFSGKWNNQHCSEMELHISTDGSVRGVYATGVGAPTPAEQFALLGFVADDQISFTVNFGRFGSLTAWVGQLTVDSSGAEFIETFWHLTENVPDVNEPARLWSSVTTGHDVFKRGPVSPGCRPQVLRSPSHPLQAAK
jgi:hypothetical protein